MKSSLTKSEKEAAVKTLSAPSAIRANSDASIPAPIPTTIRVIPAALNSSAIIAGSSASDAAV